MGMADWLKIRNVDELKKAGKFYEKPKSHGMIDDSEQFTIAIDYRLSWPWDWGFMISIHVSI